VTYSQDPNHPTPGGPGQPGPEQPYGQRGPYPPASPGSNAGHGPYPPPGGNPGYGAYPAPGAQPPQQSMTDQWLKATIEANKRSLKVTIPIMIAMVLFVTAFFIFAVIFNSR